MEKQKFTPEQNIISSQRKETEAQLLREGKAYIRFDENGEEFVLADDYLDKLVYTEKLQNAANTPEGERIAEVLKTCAILKRQLGIKHRGFNILDKSDLTPEFTIDDLCRKLEVKAPRDKEEADKLFKILEGLEERLEERLAKISKNEKPPGHEV